MSSVCNIILATIPSDGGIVDFDIHPNVDKFNEFLMNTYKNTLSKVDQYAGGTRNMEVDVFMGAFNYLDVDELILKFKEIQWEYPEDANLIFKDEHDDYFHIIKGND